MPQPTTLPRPPYVVVDGDDDDNDLETMWKEAAMPLLEELSRNSHGKTEKPQKGPVMKASLEASSRGSSITWNYKPGN
jgi:hypothetical protein